MLSRDSVAVEVRHVAPVIRLVVNDFLAFF
jgi:hypothetical protein